MCGATDVTGFHIPVSANSPISVTSVKVNSVLDPCLVFEVVTDPGIIRFNVTRSLPPSSRLDFRISGFRNPVQRPGPLTGLRWAQEINAIFGSDLGIFGRALVAPRVNLTQSGNFTSGSTIAALLPTTLGASSDLSFTLVVQNSNLIHPTIQVTIQAGPLDLNLSEAYLSLLTVDNVDMTKLAKNSSVVTSNSISLVLLATVAKESLVILRFSGVQNPIESTGSSTSVTLTFGSSSKTFPPFVFSPGVLQKPKLELDGQNRAYARDTSMLQITFANVQPLDKNGIVEVEFDGFDLPAPPLRLRGPLLLFRSPP